MPVTTGGIEAAVGEGSVGVKVMTPSVVPSTISPLSERAGVASENVMRSDGESHDTVCMWPSAGEKRVSVLPAAIHISLPVETAVLIWPASAVAGKSNVVNRMSAVSSESESMRLSPLPKTHA